MLIVIRELNNSQGGLALPGFDSLVKH